MSKTTGKKKPATRPRTAERRIAAGEFKAKCLSIMDEIKETGQPVVVTKRGEPVIKIVRFSNSKNNQKKKDDIFGRLEGVIEIVGDPDDLVRPIIPLEDWDMLK